MSEIIIKNYTPEDIYGVIEVQKEYKNKYPNYSIRGEDLYTHHPIFENGKNIFCAFNNKGKLLAYSPIVPAPVNEDAPSENFHHIWTDIIYNPEIEELDSVRNMLNEKILNRALEIKSKLPERKTRLAIQKFSDETGAMDYFISKGFDHYESEYIMNRNLTEPIIDIPTPKDVNIRKWKITTKEDKEKYIKADNLSNPNNPITLEKLEWFLENLWSEGAAISAFDDNGELVGSVMTYWFKNGTGVTEEIFVIPQWRRKGIAQYLVKEALTYLKECGKLSAELEVRKSNEKAVNLYKKMGYEISVEGCFLGLFI